MRSWNFSWGETLALVMFICVLLLTGCETVEPVTETITVTKVEFVPYECGEPPPIDPFHYLDFEWQVLPVEGYELFTLTARDYEALGKNMANLIAAVKQLRAQRNFYKECVERSQNGQP